jgi:triosephosphate isomerase
MHKTPAETRSFIETFLPLWKSSRAVEVALLPPFTSLESAERLLVDTEIALGAQDLYVGESGAFTGEVSGDMLRACGCTYVLVGHSERRALFHEDDSLLNRKLRAAFAAGLSPVLCIGETLNERRQGRTEAKIGTQLSADLLEISRFDLSSAVIAYEPIWAIGTGETATPDQAQEAIFFIRNWLSHAYDEEISEVVRILYGGSVTPENATALIAEPDIDGFLVGGASLLPSSFAQIITAVEIDPS